MQDSKTLRHANFLRNDSEMGNLIKDYNWENSKLGSIDNWQISLRTHVGSIINSSFPMFLFWGEDNLCFYNDAYRPIFGNDGKHPAIGKKAIDVWPEIWDFIGELITQVKTTGKPAEFHNLHVPYLRNGIVEDVYWTFCYSAAFNDLGEIEGVLVTCIEATESVHNKKELIEKDFQFQALADNIPNLAWMALADGNIYWYNKQWYDFTGKTPKEMEGWGWQVVHDPEILPDVVKNWKKSISEGKRFEMIFPLRGKDGIYKQFLTRIIPILDTDGIIQRWFGTNTDITEYIESKKKIEESERKFRLLADSMPQNIWTSDPEGNLNYYNQSVFEFTGRNLDEINKHGWLDIVHPDDREENAKIWIESIKTGKDFYFQHRFQKFDGTYEWQLSRAKPQKDELGKIVMWVGTSTNIQEQKDFLETLELEVEQRTQDLAKNNLELAKINKELQSFAYISSHDLQEPLRKIQTFSNRIMEKEINALSENGKDMFKRMQLSAERMQALIDDLLAYSRTHNLEKDFKPTSIKSIVDLVTEDLKEELQEAKAELNIDCDVIIDMIPFQFQQIFHNFISNSLKFANKNENLKISILAKTITVDKTFSDFLVLDKKYCHIKYEDNGIGFEAQYGNQIFELFQRLHSAKEYKGTGIGLAIVKKIVENHNGKINAIGEPGVGATFNIFIPISDENL